MNQQLLDEIDTNILTSKDVYRQQAIVALQVAKALEQQQMQSGFTWQRFDTRTFVLCRPRKSKQHNL